MKKAPATALLALTTMSATAFGQNVITTSSGFNWSGVYAGLNAGGVWNDTCANWTPYVSNAAVNNFLNNCPNKSSFIYGLQVGYNFLVTPQLLIGGEGDFGGWSTSTRFRSATVGVGAPLPAGTYQFVGKQSPNGAGTVRMRLGFVADQWMPYATGGFAYASGTPTTTIYYTPVGANAPTATSNAVRTLSTNGWTAGAGIEYGAASSFSVKLEWLYYQFGHGQRSVGSCSGPGCSLFYGIGSTINFQTHNSAELTAVRLGVNYRFNWP